MSTHTSAPTRVLTNPLYDERRFIVAALSEAERRFASEPDPLFQPAFALPDDSPELKEFFSASAVRLSTLEGSGLVGVSLLDLMGNPRTRTTKTFASLVIVARAVNHIWRSGEPITIVTPSSGNKATALRDAVARAHEAGLVKPEELNIVVVVPEQSIPKLWSSRLDESPVLLRQNPVAVLCGSTESVKQVARGAVELAADDVQARTGRRVWHTLALGNYVGADAIRARALAQLDPAAGARLHVHAVSSAYGLIGHALGAELQQDERTASYLLVQHLGTPDMVLNLLFDSFNRDAVPKFELSSVSGLFEQSTDPHFPAVTFDPNEVLERTFYTHAPPTSDLMTALIRRQGGSGIVVSLHECVEQYPALRRTLAAADVNLPADPRELREWSLVMALTGLKLARQRDLIDPSVTAIVHGTGSYSGADYTALPASRRTVVQSAAELAEVLNRACENHAEVLA